MGRLRQVRWQEPQPGVKNIYEQLSWYRDPVVEPRKATGTPVDYWTTFALVPDLLTMAYYAHSPLLSPGRTLTPPFRELVIVRLEDDNDTTARLREVPAPATS